MKTSNRIPRHPSRTEITLMLAKAMPHPANSESWPKPRQIWQTIFRCFLVSLLASLLSLPLTTGAIWAATDPVPSIYYQNLVELFSRKSMSVQKPSALLVEAGYWQSEMVIFRDATYGTEIWRLTNDPDYSRHNDSINRTPWNCDGSRLAFMSSRYVPGEQYDGQPKWYIMDPDGSRFRRLLPHGVSKASDIPPYTTIAPWDRVNPSNIYFGYYDGLYKVDVSNGDLMTLEEALPQTGRRKEICTYLSEHNRVMVNEHNTYQRDGSFFPNVYMIDLNKAHGAPGRLIQYSMHFSIQGVQGHSISNECCFHDLMFMRTADDSWQLTYEAPEGGEALMFEIPYDGDPDSIRIAMTGYDSALPYYSHPFWGPDGVRVIYFGETAKGAENHGLQLRNQRTQTPIATLIAGAKAGGGHNAWDGYDPNWVFAAPSVGEWDGTIIKAKTDGSSAAPFVKPYSRINGGSYDYSSLPRPAQSPDATKVFFASSMFQTADTKVDCYIGVVRHPYPPANVRVSSLSQNQVVLAWDRPQISREIKGFRVYRSTDSDSHFLEISPSSITEQGYADNTVSVGHAYYYAVTSEEHSGMESDYLSNVPRANISSSSTNWDNYRAEGFRGWDTAPPGPITSLSVSQLSAGVYQLTWQGSVDNDVRYYNIYYSVAGPPACTQQRLIASLRSIATKFIDWQANPGYAPFYGVTAVDRAGNESLPRHFPSGDSDTTPPAPTRDLR